MTNKRTPFARFRKAMDPATRWDRLLQGSSFVVHGVTLPLVLTAPRPIWATATNALADGTATTATMDWTALGAHVGRCNGLRGRMFLLRSAADSFGSFLAPRTVTALVALGIVAGVGTLFF